MDDEAILEAIREHAADAAGALAAIQSVKTPLTVEVIKVLARRANKSEPEFWLEALKERGLVTPFVSALRGRGVPLAGDVLDDPDEVIPTELLRPFLARAQTFRCQIRKNGEIAGSGVLVGPSLVLTAWHVIAVDVPGKPQEPAPMLEVVLADDIKFDARVPAAFQSECGDGEYVRRRVVHDADVADRHDVALLQIVQPAATHLGHLALATPVPPPTSKGRVVLVHFPEGTQKVIDFGFAGRIKDLTARWRHNVPTEGGSSGGACFNKNLEFMGVHQGRFDNGARFVPAELFVDSILEIVRRDVAPPTLWSLDGKPTGRLVVGRNPFFQAVAAAGDLGGRVRGVRIKRTDVDAGTTGLAFSYDILDQLLIRRGPEHILVRVEQDKVVDDLAADIHRRVNRTRLDLAELPSDRTAAAGQAPPEAVLKERGVNLAAVIESAAATAGAIVWLFIDNPTVPLTESVRLTLESFIGAALTKPHLRLVIAGLETVALPGAEFAGPPTIGADTSPGLIVEFLGDFRRADILDLLTVASQDLRGTVNDAEIAYATNRALFGLENSNGLYSPALIRDVTSRLRDDLRYLAGVVG